MMETSKHSFYPFEDDNGLIEFKIKLTYRLDSENYVSLVPPIDHPAVEKFIKFEHEKHTI